MYLMVEQKKQQISRIFEWCFEKFKTRSKAGKFIHVKNNQLWARIRANELGIELKAFNSFIDSFKKIYGICSRKVEKHISDKNFFNKSELDENLNKFKSDIMQEIKIFLMIS